MAVPRASARHSRSPSPPTDSGRITVPSLNKDPIQSLCPLSVVVTVSGHEYEIPAMSAADWLMLLMVPDLNMFDVFPGLLPEEEFAQVLSLDISAEEVLDLATEVIATASARSWWVALRLIDVARRSWDVLGAEMSFKGVDATTVSLSSWLDMLLLIVLRNLEPKDVAMFTMRLELPPPDSQDDPEEPTMTAEAFMAMAG